jgi:hypothetical protein
MLVHTCLLFGLGLRLIPVIVKAALAICGIGGQGVAGAPVVVNLWPARVAVFAISFAGSSGAASLADYFVSQVCGCAVAFLVSCLHSVVLEQVLAFFLAM